jgi:alpha-galactosidase
MTLWAMLAAPLLAGNDLSKMSAETKSILMNKDVIAIDQDALGKQGTRISQSGPVEIWSRRLQDGSAVAMFNRSAEPQKLKFAMQIPNVQLGRQMKDVWSGTLVKVEEGHVFSMPAHGVVLLVAK